MRKENLDFSKMSTKELNSKLKRLNSSLLSMSLQDTDYIYNQIEEIESELLFRKKNV